MLIAEYDYDMDIAVQREEAFEDGKAEGIAEGVANGINNAIKMLYRLNFSEEEVCKNLVENFSLTSEEAQKYLDEYQE